MQRQIPLSLYIHIPWCQRKCPYCDFNSYRAPNNIPETEYLNALLQDLNNDLQLIQGRELSSIFIGGGTPTMLAPKTFATLLDQTAKTASLKQNIEITTEANPGTIDKNTLDELKLAGINRLSIGVQSFNNKSLKQLGRIHTAQQAINNIKNAQDCGFQNINLDLMYALPQQTIDEAINDVTAAINLNPTHLSWYQLTIEPNTVFYKQRPETPNEATSIKIQNEGQQLLATNNYQQYEISAYSQPTHQCQHNLNYWQFGDYLGIGAGAHSKITNLTTGAITRFSKHEKPNEYLANDSYIATSETITQTQLPTEFMMNALRLLEPIPLQLFTERTGLEIATIEKQLYKAQDLKLITIANQTIQTTTKGRTYLNDLIALFID